jgi:hypothetical protein
MKTKTLPKLKKQLQELFNKFIRLRDQGKPCISCERPKDYLQAGHFYSVRMYEGLTRITVTESVPGVMLLMICTY